MEFAKRGHVVTLVSRKHLGSPKDETLHGVRNLRLSGFSFTGNVSIDKIKDLCYTLSILRALPKAQIIVTNTFFLPILTAIASKAFGETVVDMQRYPKGQLWLYSRCKRVRTPSTA